MLIRSTLRTYKGLAIYIFDVGIPIPVVAISAGIAHDHYGHDEL